MYITSLQLAGVETPRHVSEPLLRATLKKKKRLVRAVVSCRAWEKKPWTAGWARA